MQAQRGRTYLVSVGYQSKTLVNLPCRRVQCDEIWSFVGAKEKNATAEQKVEGWGDAWTWVALDADTKLVPCWYVGQRDASAAMFFIHDLKNRLANRVQLTTDGNKCYLNAVDDAFGCEVDYAMLIKVYGPGAEGADVRYSPSEVTGAVKTAMTGKPAMKHVSTSFIERQNLTMRMQIRPFTRLTNAFSKKLANHEAAIALHYMHYNSPAFTRPFASPRRWKRVLPTTFGRLRKSLPCWACEPIVAL